MKTTAKELRFQSKRIMEAVARGEEVIITYRGKPRAKIVPVKLKDGNDNKTDSHNLFGIWKDRKDIIDVDAYIRKLRKGRF